MGSNDERLTITGRPHGKTADNMVCHIRKDEGWSWVVLFASFSLQTITIGVCLSSGLFVIEFMETFNTRQSETSWIASMQIGVAYLIGAPLSGLVCQTFSHRISVVIGGLVLFVGLLASAFANGIVHLYLTCGFVAGIGIGLIYSPSIGVVGHYFDRRLAMALGITMAGGGCGAMLFSQIFYLLISFYSWRGAIFIAAALSLNCCVLGALMFPMTTSKLSPNNHPKVVQNGVSKTNPHSVKSFYTDLALLKDLHFMLFFLNSFLFCFGSTAIFILLADYAIDCGINPKFAAALLSITGLLSTLGRFTMAGLMHCLRSLKVVHLYNFSTVFCGVAVLLMPLAKDFLSFVIPCSVFGFCYGGCCSSSPVVASQFFGVERLTTIYGYTLIASGLGCLLGSPVAGWIYEKTKNYDLSILLNGATIILSFIVLVPLCVISCRRTRHSRLLHSFIDIGSTSAGTEVCKQPL